MGRKRFGGHAVFIRVLQTIGINEQTMKAVKTNVGEAPPGESFESQIAGFVPTLDGEAATRAMTDIC